MIKISTAQRESLKLLKPTSLKLLSEKISLVYDIKVLQLLLTYENEEEELVLLKSEEEYMKILQSERDFQIKAYISPLSQKKKYILLSIASLFLTYALVKYASARSIEVSVHKNSEYLISFFYSFFVNLYFVIVEIIKASLWVPSLGNVFHFVNLIWSRYKKTRTLVKNHLAYLLILLCTFIDLVGYYITVFLTVWLVLVYFHVLLHSPKPRSDRISSFLKVLGWVMAASVLRLISF
jgi:hypothetical protein